MVGERHASLPSMDRSFSKSMLNISKDQIEGSVFCGGGKAGVDTGGGREGEVCVGEKGGGGGVSGGGERTHEEKNASSRAARQFLSGCAFDSIDDGDFTINTNRQTNVTRKKASSTAMQFCGDSSVNSILPSTSPIPSSDFTASFRRRPPLIGDSSPTSSSSSSSSFSSSKRDRGLPYASFVFRSLRFLSSSSSSSSSLLLNPLTVVVIVVILVIALCTPAISGKCVLLER